MVVIASARAALAAVTARMIDLSVESVDIHQDATGIIAPSLLVAMMAPSEFSFRIRRHVSSNANSTSTVSAADSVPVVAPAVASARRAVIEANKFTEYLVHEVRLTLPRI